MEDRGCNRASACPEPRLHPLNRGSVRNRGFGGGRRGSCGHRGAGPSRSRHLAEPVVAARVRGAPRSAPDSADDRAGLRRGGARDLDSVGAASARVDDPRAAPFGPCESWLRRSPVGADVAGSGVGGGGQPRDLLDERLIQSHARSRPTSPTDTALVHSRSAYEPTRARRAGGLAWWRTERLRSGRGGELPSTVPRFAS